MALRAKSWILVLTGAVMTIISALLVHYIVAANMKEVSVLHSEHEKLQSSIESFWQSSDRVERNLNTALVILSSQNPSKETVRGLLATTGKEYKISGAGVTAKFVLNEASEHRQKIISQIDEFYAEQIDISEQVMTIEEDNAFYINLALFLQIFGLILVLSRDLGIRD